MEADRSLYGDAFEIAEPLLGLGDDCVVEAGCYVTAGARVRWVDGSVVKARELSGRAGLLFWRNSQTGVLEVVVREKIWGKLNPELHSVD